MTHLCSFKVTHTKNTIWRRARISEAISSTPQACGVVFHHPRRSVRKVPIFYEEFRAQGKPINRRDRGGGLATDLPAGKKPFLPGGKTATLSAWCWVAFGEQTMVISRECRSPDRSATCAGGCIRWRSLRSRARSPSPGLVFADPVSCRECGCARKIGR